MDVTVRGMDATSEHTRMYLLRVTEMRVLKLRSKAYSVKDLVYKPLTGLYGSSFAVYTS